MCLTMKISSAYISKQKCTDSLAIFYGIANRLRIIEPLRGRINQLQDWKVKSSDNVVSVIPSNLSCNLLLLVPFFTINEIMEANRLCSESRTFIVYSSNKIRKFLPVLRCPHSVRFLRL